MRIDIRMLGRAAAVAVVMVVAGCESPEDRVAGHFERGEQLVAEGRDEQAALEFRNALRIDGEHVPSRRAMARLQERLGNLRAAATSWRAVAEYDQTDVESRVTLAETLLAAGSVEDAERFSNEALALEPDNIAALATRAGVLYRKGETDAAVEAAQKVLEREPDNRAANGVLVARDVVIGDIDAALRRVETMLADAPDDEALNVLKLRVITETGDTDAMGAQLARIVEVASNNADYRAALAQFLAANDDLAGAEAQLREIAAIRQDQLQPILDIVTFVFRVRGADAAEAELMEQIATATAQERPTRAQRLRQTLVDLYFQTDRADEARAVLAEIASGEGVEAFAARARLATLAYGDGDRAEAERMVAEILAADADNAAALSLRARIAIDDLRPDDAIADLRQALAAEPEDVSLMLLEALAQERAGNLALAGERLASAARLSNFELQASLPYARFLRQRGDLSAAEALMTEVTRRNPNSIEALSALAAIRLELGDVAGAESAAASMREIDRTSDATNRVTASILAAQGRRSEALSMLEGLSAAAADDAPMVALVRAYLRDGDVDRAEAYLRSQLEADPDDIRARILLAELPALRGDADGAEAAMRAVVADAPESELGHGALARMLAWRGDVDGAISTVDAALPMVENDINLLVLKAQLLEGQRRFGEAIDAYRAAFDISPDSVIVVNNLASLIAEHRSDDPESMALATRAARRLRGYDVPHFQDTYGWIQFLNGEFEAAAERLEQAAEGLPDNALVRYHAGRAQAAVGRNEAARGHLEAALSLEPDFPKAASAREALAALDVPAQ